MNSKNILSIPHSKSVIYENNLIELAVCELRFPTIMGFDKDPPTEIQKKLRNEYPLVEMYESPIQLGFESKHNYLFSSRAKDWSIAMTSSAISLETSKYTEFNKFKLRLQKLINISKNYINSPIFTRVGLRYVNNIPFDKANVDFKDFLNPNLASMLPGALFGELYKCSNEIRGFTKEGRYTFRHGWENTQSSTTNIYILDFDFHELDVSYNNVLKKVIKFNEINFDFFKWCVGEKTKKMLGKSTRKG